MTAADVSARETREPGSTPPRRLTGTAAFGTVAAGQVVSMFGSELTSFAVGVWVFERTGSATAFSLIAFFAVLPGIVASPFAGALVDRWNRRKALLLNDAGAGVATLALLALAAAGRLELGWIYLLVAVSSVFQAFQFPALSATVPLLVPKRHLTRANGLLELGSSGSTMAAPLIAGVMLTTLGLDGVLLGDLATFLFAVVTLLLVRIPRPPAASEAAPSRPSLLAEAAFGWHYIRQRPGLVALLALFAVVNFSMGIVQILLAPLVLGFASPVAFGTVMTIAGAGVAVGSLAITVWGGPQRKLRAIFGALLVQGVILFAGGLEPSLPLVATAAFVFSLCMPVIYACSQSIWQTKVEPAVHGRVFAMRRVVAWSSLPLAYLLAGPLADSVFEPLLAPGGALAGSVGRWIGVGPGRGVGLLFIVLGLFTLAALAVAALYPRLRRLEEELPDAWSAEESPIAAEERKEAQ